MRILIAEDDEALAQFVRQGLENEHYAVDVFPDGEQARLAATDGEYDVVVLDLNLPRMDGISVLRQLRVKKPSLPVMVLTQRNRVEDRVQCLDIGADDYVPKQLSPTSLDIFHIREDLLTKLRLASASSRSPLLDPAARKPAQPSAQTGIGNLRGDPFPAPPAIVAIGSSTGGPKALQEILPLLPGDLRVPILVVQHMPLGFTATFAQRLNLLCQLRVREATHGEPLSSGVAYIAPAGRHMTVERSSSLRVILRLDPEPHNALHIPSVDIMMQSVARVFGRRALGIILTGMGCDGAEGMRAIHAQGGLTIGQDQATCTVYGMPRACAESGVLLHAVPLSQIPGMIVQATCLRRSAGAV